MSSSPLNLHPEALEDLRRSGLSDATIAEAGLYTPAPGDLPRLLSARLVDQVRHVLVFPYDGAGHGGAWRRDGEFVRCKLFPPVGDGQGHTIRYYQRAGTPPRLYVPARARAALADPTVPLLITEGEKKALKANQEGLACVAVGGLWNWQTAGRPIADLDRIDWYEREAVIVPDSDVWTRPDLLQPVFALGKELEGRGAKVAVLKLPSGAGGAKVGLDDYLCAHPRRGVRRAAAARAEARGLQPDERLVARLGEAQGGRRRTPAPSRPRSTCSSGPSRSACSIRRRTWSTACCGTGSRSTARSWRSPPRVRRTGPISSPKGSRSATPSPGPRR